MKWQQKLNERNYMLVQLVHKYSHERLLSPMVQAVWNQTPHSLQSTQKMLQAWQFGASLALQSPHKVSWSLSLSKLVSNPTGVEVPLGSSLLLSSPEATKSRRAHSLPLVDFPCFTFLCPFSLRPILFLFLSS